MLAGYAKVVSIYEALCVVIERLIVRVYAVQQWCKHTALRKIILLYTYSAFFGVKQHKETSFLSIYPRNLVNCRSLVVSSTFFGGGDGLLRDKQQ